ncbi:hypothetical protein [Litorivivens sp.]|uniref:hypothetical protein n=2 Tax=Litorivivens sp. TaxID=2020868 RepID=UPI0035671467
MSKADRHSEAILGIQLAEPRRKATGSPPSDEELAQLREGSLTNERREEVLSHLTTQPERYRQWLDLAAMAETPESSSGSLLTILSRGLNNWLIDWRYAAGGLASMAAIALLLGQLQTPPSDDSDYLAESTLSDMAGASGAPEQEIHTAAPAAPASQKAERELASRMAMDRTEELQTAAKMAPPTELSRRCIALPHPISKRTGTLCAVALNTGVSSLRWQSSNTADVLELDDLHEAVLELKVSADQQWLALQTAQAVHVQQLKNLFGDNTERAQLPFNAGTATLRWDENVLIVSVLQALGDSDDDQKYRYLPETGELIKP